MSSTDQKEYLKKYLGSGGKKKKKLKVSKGKGTRIIDDDVTVPAAAGDDDDGRLETAEEAPQVVSVTSDAPPASADKRWKTLEDCDLEELESQREILNESLKMLQEDDPARDVSSGDEAPPRIGQPLPSAAKPAARQRHDSESSEDDSGGGGASSGSESSSDSDSGRRRGRGRHDSDESPPRRRPAGGASPDTSPPEKRRRRRAGSDPSPPRRRPAADMDGADSDASPPRRRKPASDEKRRKREESPSGRRGRGQADSDESPPRRRPRAGSADSASPPRSWRRPQTGESPRPGGPPTHTQDGKRAGLQDINALKEENRAARRREQKAMAEMDEHVSGRHADTKIRGRKLQENKEKAAKKAEEEQKAKERKKKYDAWSKGLKQAENQRARLQDHLHEASKPLARYADDADLEAELRRRQRQDDPMAEYMQRKKAKQDGPLKERPRYNKSEPPPNRYSIWPGYRWDGVDRSNGFEKQLFLRRNAKKARDIDAYKWSTEDM
ncbi:BUD13 [Amphibalanus amphitrite]|uniref:BUD13 homolog n=1 Tax=Amphibalanus amphitrite TaxID=1232801 RepID=A0A6A4WJ90_AMPAM|nr:BUD13 homolog [Amphibalanus amphitrite]XP_043235766.1 BUD13 homolog [Amphibalanus amphitrite]XP_043235767.1 BUD13 homolog [Amphibalanus amphitrite]KAF0305299.1 BUD13 [Amphibalanus amphitrite]